MITGQYGLKTPEDGDKGKIVFDALEGNIQKFIDHTHNGTNSGKIISTDITKETSTIAAGTWTDIGNGNHKVTVTCPGAVTLAICNLRFRITSGTGQHRFINPTVNPLSITQFEVIVNDSTIGLEVLYI